MRRLASILLLAVTTTVTAGGGRSHADLLVYSPDFNPGNLGVLSQAFDHYLTEQGLAIPFQAFARYEDFLDQATTREPAFLSAPPWVEAAADELEPTPLARPLRDGRPSYRKALLVGVHIATPEDLATASIATTAHTASGPVLDDLLESLGVDAARVRVIPVPKDVDALLALGFGQVDAALVAMGQLERLAHVNPRTSKDLKSLALSDEIPFPLIYSTAFASDEIVDTLADSLARIDRSDAGMSLLKLLGYDAMEIVARAPRERDGLVDASPRSEGPR